MLLQPPTGSHGQCSTQRPSLCVHPDGAILVDQLSMRRVSAGFSASTDPFFFPMSDDDTVVLLQPGEIMEDKQVAAYEDILERYSYYYLCEDRRLLGPMAKAGLLKGWLNGESIGGPSSESPRDYRNLLSEIPQSPLGDYPKVTSWRCCQRSTMRIKAEKHCETYSSD
ncbi:hypothetical protein BDV09DRAFT_72093 [Aspergillus tetrazonus]